MERKIPRDAGVTCLLSDPFFCRPATVAVGERRPPPGTSCNHVTRPDPTGSRKLLNFVFHHSAAFCSLLPSSYFLFRSFFLQYRVSTNIVLLIANAGRPPGACAVPSPCLESNQHQNRRPLFYLHGGRGWGQKWNKSDAGDKQVSTG